MDRVMKTLKRRANTGRQQAGKRPKIVPSSTPKDDHPLGQWKSKQVGTLTAEVTLISRKSSTSGKVDSNVHHPYATKSPKTYAIEPIDGDDKLSSSSSGWEKTNEDDNDGKDKGEGGKDADKEGSASLSNHLSDDESQMRHSVAGKSPRKTVPTRGFSTSPSSSSEDELLADTCESNSFMKVATI